MTGPIRYAALTACSLVIATAANAQTTPLPKTPDASGPQTAVPGPAPTQPDIPGGSSRDGIVRPPSTGSNTPVITPPVQGNMPVIVPPGTMQGNMPVIVPPGSTGTQPKPVPK